VEGSPHPEKKSGAQQEPARDAREAGAKLPHPDDQIDPAAEDRDGEADDHNADVVKKTLAQSRRHRRVASAAGGG
jgi:hypothetical protein